MIDGLGVNREALDDINVTAAAMKNAGPFPVGTNDLWHGGVHIGPAVGIPFHNAFPGTIVAARLGAENIDLYGSPNFLLLRHTWPPFADEEGTPFYSLYVHLTTPEQAPGSLDEIGRSADEAPWFTTAPQLRVTVPLLNVRGDPDPNADVETQVSRGSQLPIIGDPTEGERFQWVPVDAPGVPYTCYAAERRLGGDRLAERIEPPLDDSTVETLKEGHVAALDRPVAAGEQLWWMGEFGLPEEEAPCTEVFQRSPTLHWEVFAGTPVFGHEDGTGKGNEVGAWRVYEDDTDDYRAAPEEAGALSALQPLWEESWATDLVESKRLADAPPDDRLPFFLEEERIRRTAAKFRSEWGIKDIDTVMADEKGYTEWDRCSMKDLQWWNEAKFAGVDLPDSSKVWHYHPVGALEAIQPRFTAVRNGTPLDGPVETIEDVATKVIEDIHNVSGDLSSLSEGPLRRVRREMNQHVQVQAASPATETPETFANVAFRPYDGGPLTLNGTDYILGLVATDTSQNDPSLYEMLAESGPMQGVPSRTPPSPDAGGPPPDAQWTEGGWFGEFEQNIWTSITESEGTLQALNTWDTAFLSVGPVQQTAGRGEAKGELQGALHTLEANAPDVYWHHFGRFGLRPVEASIVGGAKKAHFKLRGTVLNTAEEKTQLQQFKWPHRFKEAMQDPTVRYWIMREGFRRLERMRDRTLVLTVEPPSRDERISFHARIGDLFRRDLMQALLLDWHVNYPAEVWMQELGEYYRKADGELVYDPGNQWRDHLQDHLQTWAGRWDQTLTEALPFATDDQGNLDKDNQGRLTLDGPLDLTDTEAYELTASLLQGRTEGEMTDPVGRAADILGYTNGPDVQNLVTENQPEGSQTGPDFLNRIMSLGENDRYTADGVWNTIQNQNRQSLSFDSPAEN